ncbi:hypothetical protein EDB19DRAFT_1360737 [Suillus lakei]|nr:hypothetical protein EDB19DRAFT_1360737 [Suillus lakei]
MRVRFILAVVAAVIASISAIPIDSLNDDDCPRQWVTVQCCEGWTCELAVDGLVVSMSRLHPESNHMTHWRVGLLEMCTIGTG